MKSKNNQNSSVVKPLIKDLVNLEKANKEVVKQSPVVESTPLEAADLYQDDGGGYNRDFTFPQE